MPKKGLDKKKASEPVKIFTGQNKFVGSDIPLCRCRVVHKDTFTQDLV